MSIEQSILRSYFEGKKLRELYKEYNSYIVQKVLHSSNILKYCFKNFESLANDIIYQALKRSRYFSCDSLTWRSIEEIKNVGFESSLKVCCYMLNKPSMSTSVRPYSHIYAEDIIKVSEPVRDTGYLKLKWSKPLIKSISKILFTGVFILKSEPLLKIIIDGVDDYDSFILNLSKVGLKPQVLQFFVDLVLKQMGAPRQEIIALDNDTENIDASENLQVSIDNIDELF